MRRLMSAVANSSTAAMARLVCIPGTKVPEVAEKVVTVRQVPFTLMLSPRLQSVRMECALEMVSEVPPVASDRALARVVAAACRARTVVIRLRKITERKEAAPVGGLFSCFAGLTVA